MRLLIFLMLSIPLGCKPRETLESDLSSTIRVKDKNNLVYFFGSNGKKKDHVCLKSCGQSILKFLKNKEKSLQTNCIIEGSIRRQTITDRLRRKYHTKLETFLDRVFDPAEPDLLGFDEDKTDLNISDDIEQLIRSTDTPSKELAKVICQDTSHAIKDSSEDEQEGKLGEKRTMRLITLTNKTSESISVMVKYYTLTRTYLSPKFTWHTAQWWTLQPEKSSRFLSHEGFTIKGSKYKVYAKKHIRLLNFNYPWSKEINLVPYQSQATQRVEVIFHEDNSVTYKTIDDQK